MELEVQRLKQAKPNWFKRHLNWTLVIGALGIMLVLTQIVYPLRVATSFYVANMNPSHYSGIASIVYYAILLALNAWVLRQKNRSIAWLLFFFLDGPALPTIITLLLKKKSRKPITNGAS